MNALDDPLLQVLASWARDVFEDDTVGVLSSAT